MQIFGTILPLVMRVIAPCDVDGVPAMDEDELSRAHFETGAWCFAWFGRAALFPFGDVMPRMVDPDNPQQYAPGDL